MAIGDDARVRAPKVLATLQSDSDLDYLRPELDGLEHALPEELPQHLRRMYDAHVHDFDYEMTAPSEDLARAVSVDSFMMHVASDDAKAPYEFREPDAYLRDVLLSANPSARLTADLPLDDDHEIIPAERSWLIPERVVHGLGARDTINQLRILLTPPIVLLRLPRDLSFDKIQVRKPNGLDTIPALDDYWIKGAVGEELLDSSIPRGACGEAQCLL